MRKANTLHNKSLSEEQKADFKSLLNQALEERLKELGEGGTGSEYLMHQAPDFLDRASLEIDGTLNLRIKERDGRLAEKIRVVLKKIEDGTFGLCEDCGKSIPEKRLRARPVATRCIECKQKQEDEEKMKGR
jgi:DnaK suppressor protein